MPDAVMWYFPDLITGCLKLKSGYVNSLGAVILNRECVGHSFASPCPFSVHSNMLLQKLRCRGYSRRIKPQF